MKIELHDGTVDDPRGTLCYRLEVDYEYQLEQCLIDAVLDYPSVVLVKTDDGRIWRRRENGFTLSPIMAL